jgi:hypothetical protein
MRIGIPTPVTRRRAERWPSRAAGPGLTPILALLTACLLVGCDFDIFPPQNAGSKCTTSAPLMAGTWTGSMGGSLLTVGLHEVCVGKQFLCDFCTSEWQVEGDWTWKDVSGSASYSAWNGVASISLNRQWGFVIHPVSLDVVGSPRRGADTLSVSIHGTFQTPADSSRTDLRPPSGVIQIVRR